MAESKRKEAIIPKVLSEADWSALPVLPITEQVRPTASEAQANAQIGYDENYLYIRLTAEEEEIRREETAPLGMPCRDSCLEFFFRPEETDLRYINFEFNPNGCLYLGFGSGPGNLFRIVVSDAKRQALFAPALTIGAGKWEVQFRVPYTFICHFFPNFSAYPGKLLPANFYKCGDLLEKPHYLAWNMITRTGTGLFHTPEEFGTLRFGE